MRCRHDAGLLLEDRVLVGVGEDRRDHALAECAVSASSTLAAVTPSRDAVSRSTSPCAVNRDDVRDLGDVRSAARRSLESRSARDRAQARASLGGRSRRRREVLHGLQIDRAPGTADLGPQAIHDVLGRRALAVAWVDQHSAARARSSSSRRRRCTGSSFRRRDHGSFPRSTAGSAHRREQLDSRAGVGRICRACAGERSFGITT